MILTFQTSFPTVDEEARYNDINVPSTRCVDDLFKVVCAETGVSLNSPMELEINGEKFYRNDTRTLEEAKICEYDMVEAKILKNGGKPIPGNITVMDMYDALGDRLKRLRMDEPVTSIAHSAEKVVEKSAPTAPAPAVAAPAPASTPVVAAPTVVVPKAVNAFTVKKPAGTSAFAIKKPVSTGAFAVKKPVVAAATPTATTEEKPAEPEPAVAPTASTPTPTVVTEPKPFAVKTNAFAIKKPVAANKFAIKKP